MLKRIQSAISTAHAISLAIREAPDAIRYVVEFARENGVTTEEVEFWKAARDRWMDWACHIEGGQDTPGMPLTTDGDTHMMARITAALGYGSRVLGERNELYSQITEARELLSGLSSGLGYGLGGEDESLLSMVERVRDGITENLKIMAGLRDTAQNERDELKSKLARHEAAERWHQVTAGEGELPPPIPVLWEHTEPDFKPQGCLRHSIQGNCGTYRWRYASSQDVPNV